MKCPLFTAGLMSSGSPYSLPSENCLKGECAWWDSEVEMCSVRSFIEQFENIALYLYEMEKKMPHAGQSGR